MSIPSHAYAWRPFASREMIFRELRRGGTSYYFAVDPGTQRWLIVEPAAAALLQRADGVTRLSRILRDLSRDGRAGGVSALGGLCDELLRRGLLFRSQEEHRRLSRPVYNASEVVGLHLEITNACNMTCAHCYVASGEPLPFEMSMDELRDAVDLLPPFSGKRIAVSGGEPVVRRGCMDLVEYCALERGHDVDLYTNGWKFPRKFALRVLEVNRRGRGRVRIQMSLEGATPRTHDMVRGEGAFEEALESLRMFREVGVNRDCVVFVCASKHNIHEVDDLIELCEEFDVQMLVFSQWQRQGNASDTPWSEIGPDTDAWVEAGEKILEYDGPRLQVHGNFFGDLRNDGEGRFSLDEPRFPKHVYFYNAFPRVTPQGDILADQLWVDPDWILGNVRDGDTFETCFTSSEFFGQLQRMRERTEHIPACRACTWRRLCEGGSAGHTYAEYGHMRERDVFCESRIRWFERYVEHWARVILGDDVEVVDDGGAPADRLGDDGAGRRRELAVL